MDVQAAGPAGGRSAEPASPAPSAWPTAPPRPLRKGAARPVPVRNADYAHLSIEALREYRRALTAEEGKVSYWRRILQARLDVVEAGSGAREVDHAHLRPLLTSERVGAGRSALVEVLPVDDIPPLPSLAELWDRRVDPADEAGTAVLRARPARGRGPAVGLPQRAAPAHRRGDRRAHRALPRAAGAVPERAAARAAPGDRQRLTAPRTRTVGTEGDDVGVTLLAVALLLPVLLLFLMLMMERVERPLRVDSVSDQLESFLDSRAPGRGRDLRQRGLRPGARALLAATAPVEAPARSSPLTAP